MTVVIWLQTHTIFWIRRGRI